MSDKSNANPVHDHEGFFERILHPHRFQQQKGENEGHDGHDGDQPHEQMKDRESKTDKVKDYIHKDEEAVEDGYQYDRLM